ncbi:hypothetical protein E1B28_013095 [Marasmius oreades]|uniref:Uncharacterized protein n=1 Tax=Marasmius oreades TaxID=181124 RepID=A0A9P7RP16_9AGAR|nr:uncharacterized protein E1B28_013095 [Marasmius oreades]KAG7087114.1 hypothetical protein E1B28_013095 [Marasmius oreades]
MTRTQPPQLPSITSQGAPPASTVTTPITSVPPSSTPSTTPLAQTTTSGVDHSNVGGGRPVAIGAIAGGVVGGVLATLAIATFVFYILKRRNKKMNYILDPTPYLDTSGSDAPDMDIRERKMQMLGQREHLERELEAYEQVTQNSSSGTGAVPDGINGSNPGDIAQVLRRMEVLTQRIATLEEGMAPPDYSSGTA